MKTKYMMNGGLAFTEKKDLEKLEKHAANGWILKEFAWGGFCYKLVEGPKSETIYTIDFQKNPDDDYLKIFKASGWQHVTSYHNQIHIFSAPKGTSAIYSENEISEGKYKDFTTRLGKGAIYMLIAILILWALLMLSNHYFTMMYFPIKVMMVLSTVAFIFCIMPYVAYKIKEVRNKSGA